MNTCSLAGSAFKTLTSGEALQHEKVIMGQDTLSPLG